MTGSCSVPTLGFCMIAQTMQPETSIPPSMVDGSLFLAAVMIAGKLMIEAFNAARAMIQKHNGTSTVPGHATPCIAHGNTLAALEKQVTLMQRRLDRIQSTTPIGEAPPKERQ